MLVTAAMARVPTELRAAEADSISDSDLARLAGRIQKEFGVNESLARWSVATWAFALGIPPSYSMHGVAAPSGSAATPAVPADPSAYPVTREGLLAAIRDARADGVITPEERASLQRLAARIKAERGEDAAQNVGTGKSGRRWILVVAVCIALGIAAAFTIRYWPASSHPETQATAPDSTLPTATTQDVAVQNRTTKLERARKLDELRESYRSAREQLVTVGKKQQAARAEAQQFADRLKRAAQTAADQDRQTFGMAGETYTQSRATRTLKYAGDYIASRTADEASVATELQRLDTLLSQLESQPDTVDPDKLAPSTMPVRDVPDFDITHLFAHGLK